MLSRVQKTLFPATRALYQPPKAKSNFADPGPWPDIVWISKQISSVGLRTLAPTATWVMMAMWVVAEAYIGIPWPNSVRGNWGQNIKKLSVFTNFKFGKLSTLSDFFYKILFKIESK